MKLTVFIASPRGVHSRSTTYVNYFLRGYMTHKGNSFDIFYIKNLHISESLIQSFKTAERVLLAFPLYWDCMPSNVKAFIESLEPLCEEENNPEVAFLVNSGFPEALQSRYLERYLKKLAFRLQCKLIGTIIKSGIENRICRLYFYLLGKKFGKTGLFDRILIQRIAKPERFTTFGLFSSYYFWSTHIRRCFDSFLIDNNAYERRYDRPFMK